MTSHLGGAALEVMAADQPEGSPPGLPDSKSMLSAIKGSAASRKAIRVRFMVCPSPTSVYLQRMPGYVDSLKLHGSPSF
jgi:hypothetical protein